MPHKTGVTGALTGLAGLLALALPAGAVPRCGPLDLDVLRLDPPPSQYTDFCEREPGACAMWGDPVLDWTEERHDTLARINATVNDEIEFVSDQDNLGQEEVWSFPADCRGDCEDFALEKRRRLVALGFPPPP